MHISKVLTAGFTWHILCSWNCTDVNMLQHINCPSKLKLLKFRNNPHQHAHPLRLSAYQLSGCSVKAGTSPMLTDAISRLQIGFTTAEAEDFPNGLRCNSQILFIRVCHSEHPQTSLFPVHWKIQHDLAIIPKNLCITHVWDGWRYFHPAKVFHSLSSLPHPWPSPTAVNT